MTDPIRPASPSPAPSASNRDIAASLMRRLAPGASPMPLHARDATAAEAAVFATLAVADELAFIGEMLEGIQDKLAGR